MPFLQSAMLTASRTAPPAQWHPINEPTLKSRLLRNHYVPQPLEHRLNYDLVLFQLFIFLHLCLHRWLHSHHILCARPSIPFQLLDLVVRQCQRHLPPIAFLHHLVSIRCQRRQIRSCRLQPCPHRLNLRKSEIPTLTSSLRIPPRSVVINFGISERLLHHH